MLIKDVYDEAKVEWGFDKTVYVVACTVVFAGAGVIFGLKTYKDESKGE